ncbi:hypothetical protein N825_24810 [Skermanella stibiiresistens SB22]|uniref:Uncharacterized protein n=1 Tax=Skermanella stibiiresistens SB22 TaxID=1385369 RepID=W9HAX8_9PROT|nr:hypothetical protein [Skermanella stibiiresistens]EWY41857.1 hypothetical protein N825_24810 [Skermanella stibiiresistens SB22]
MTAFGALVSSLMLYPIEPDRFGPDRVGAHLNAITALISPQ